ncbi:MAG: relaxase/mobilization nuclease domain-containing protein, partial [Lachnospiraceae bacterium]|nr:relaxase/mobilization nuclease domain-containing protein [Lachnospiraceae bacterium]
TDLENLCAYVTNPAKSYNGAYTFGRGAEPYRAFEDFCEVQNLSGKADGRRAYHIIVSFDDKYAFCAADGMAMAYKISEFFYPDYQVVCGVHVNQGILHAHFVVNTVSMNPGVKRKLHISPRMLVELTRTVAEIERNMSQQIF